MNYTNSHGGSSICVKKIIYQENNNVLNELY
jgi:hypothetical protein